MLISALARLGDVNLGMRVARALLSSSSVSRLESHEFSKPRWLLL